MATTSTPEGPVTKSLENVARDLLWRFWSKVEFTETCWLWTAQISNLGYGRFSIRSYPTYVHRYAYEFCVGLIPEDLELDHLCRVRHCLNPDHLEVVTSQENIRRGNAGINMSGRTHCKSGHAFSGANVRVEQIKGTCGIRRICRTCERARGARYRQRKAAA